MSSWTAILSPRCLARSRAWLYATIASWYCLHSLQPPTLQFNEHQRLAMLRLQVLHRTYSRRAQFRKRTNRDSLQQPNYTWIQFNLVACQGCRCCTFNVTGEMAGWDRQKECLCMFRRDWRVPMYVLHSQDRTMLVYDQHPPEALGI